ncbi:MAG: pyridoxal phosphate-dependent aminotransferase [Flavobacteriales bacterium]|jgi:LL-diaminopimelate aminotransferase|tara:strand:+ start:261 stop:1415 length:1155 start_codon:yes stop_codon:yes gene_type:complete
MSTPTAQRLESVKEYYFSKKLREVAALIKAGNPILNMGIGSPDLPPDPSVLDAMQQSLSDSKAHMYQSYQGLPELREAIASFYQSHYDVTLNPANEILPLMGSKEGIMHISMAFLDKGDQVLIPNPGYPTYSSVTQLLEAEAVFYDLKEANNWQPDFEALDQMDTSRIKIMWLNYPHMPTGAQVDTNTFKRLIAWAKKSNVLLINDNPYSFILNDSPQSLMSQPGAMEVAMELNSLSKAFNLAGWRVGMLSGNSENINAVLKVKSNMDSGMFYGIQKGAIAALQLETSWFTELNKVYAERREAMIELATLMGSTFDPKSVGMFLWAKLNDPTIKSEEFIDTILKEHHIFITPGTIFGSQGEGYIRFSLCVKVEQIQTAINRLKS